MRRRCFGAIALLAAVAAIPGTAGADASVLRSREATAAGVRVLAEASGAGPGAAATRRPVARRAVRPRAF